MKKIELRPTGFALVDDEDFGRLSQHKWYLSRAGYAIHGSNKNGIKSFEKMHRHIMNAKQGDFIDHIDRDKLNNQKTNLRFATQLQNAHNRSKKEGTKNNYKGVFFMKSINLFQSRCRMNGQDIFLGYYKTEIAAAYAYNKKAVELCVFSSINYLPFPITTLEKKLIDDRCDRAVTKSKYKYIYFKTKSGRMKCDKWYISFVVNNTRVRKGYFDTEELARDYIKNNYSTTLKDF